MGSFVTIGQVLGSTGDLNRPEPAPNGHVMGSFPVRLWVSAQYLWR